MRYTLREASALTKLSIDTLRKRANRGAIPTIKSDGVLYLTEETLHHLLGSKAYTFTFDSLVNKWRSEMLNGYHTGKPMSERYVNKLDRCLRFYFKKLGIEPSIQGITPENLKACYASYKPDNEKQTCYFEAKKDIQRAILSFCKMLERETLIGHELTMALKEVKIYRAFNNQMQSLDIGMIQTVINEAGTPRQGRSKHGCYLYQTVTALAGLAGLRSSEIQNLKTKDIDLKASVIFIQDGKGHKSRTVGIMPQLKDYLVLWLNYRPVNKSPYLLIKKDGTKLTKDCLVQKMQDISQYLKSPITLHELRAGFATVTSSMGMPLPLIQNAMGHTDIKTTMRYVRHFESESINWLKANGVK